MGGEKAQESFQELVLPHVLQSKSAGEEAVYASREQRQKELCVNFVTSAQECKNGNKGVCGADTGLHRRHFNAAFPCVKRRVFSDYDRTLVCAESTLFMKSFSLACSYFSEEWTFFVSSRFQGKTSSAESSRRTDLSAGSSGRSGGMSLFVICALLLLQVSRGDACASGQFTESGQCCSLCPAGFGVAVECGKEDTKCKPCPQGTFSSSESLEPCLQCTTCPRGVPMVASCSATEDTQCECDNGFFLLRSHGLCTPCSKCNRGEGLVRKCGPKGDVKCQICGPGTFSEEYGVAKPCQTCTKCSDSEVEIRHCLPNSDTLCMDKKLHILSRPESDASRDPPRRPTGEEVIEEDFSPTSETPKFSPQEEGDSNNILVYVSVLAAVVLGLLIYVAYKCWRTCKQKKALSKARAAELGTAPEGEKLQSDSGVFLDSQSLQDNQPSKGTKRDSKQDNRLYINLAPHRQEEVQRLLQEGGGRGWRQLGAALGYEPEQLDLFGHGEAPAHTLLSNWAQKEGSTLGLLCSALAHIERSDVVTALTSPTQGVSVV